MSRNIKMAGVATQLWGQEQDIFGSLVRLNFTAQFITPPDDRFGQLTVSPTWQNFPKPTADMDTYMQNMHDRGIYTMVNILNGFNKKYSVHLKAIPRNAPGLDENDMANYSIIRHLAEQIVLRYGSVKDDSRVDIADRGPSWAPPGSQQVKSGLNTMSALQWLNEVNNPGWFDNGRETVMSAPTNARVSHYIWEGIQSVDPNMPMVIGPTWDWHPNYLQEFLDTWENEFGAFPKWNPDNNTGIMFSFNKYLFGPGGPWASSNVENPAVVYSEFQPIQEWLESRGLYAMVTEYGCNSEKRADLGYPDYAGLNKYEAQAKFINDQTNAMLSFPNIVGATVYQLKDDPNEHRFQYTGLMSSETQRKPSYDIVRNYFETNFPPVEFGTTTPKPVPIEITGGLADINNNSIKVLGDGPTDWTLVENQEFMFVSSIVGDPTAVTIDLSGPGYPDGYQATFSQPTAGSNTYELNAVISELGSYTVTVTANNTTTSKGRTFLFDLVPVDTEPPTTDPTPVCDKFVDTVTEEAKVYVDGVEVASSSDIINVTDKGAKYKVLNPDKSVTAIVKMRFDLDKA